MIYYCYLYHYVVNLACILFTRRSACLLLDQPLYCRLVTRFFTGQCTCCFPITSHQLMCHSFVVCLDLPDGIFQLYNRQAVAIKHLLVSNHISNVCWRGLCCTLHLSMLFVAAVYRVKQCNMVCPHSNISSQLCCHKHCYDVRVQMLTVASSIAVIAR